MRSGEIRIPLRTPTPYRPRVGQWAAEAGPDGRRSTRHNDNNLSYSVKIAFQIYDWIGPKICRETKAGIPSIRAYPSVRPDSRQWVPLSSSPPFPPRMKFTRVHFVPHHPQFRSAVHLNALRMSKLRKFFIRRPDIVLASSCLLITLPQNPSINLKDENIAEIVSPNCLQINLNFLL